MKKLTYLLFLSCLIQPLYAQTCYIFQELSPCPIGKNYDKIRHAKAREAAPTIGASYSAFKKALEDRWNVQYSMDVSLIPQWGKPHGGPVPVQAGITPSINWMLFNSKQYGSGSIQFFYQRFEYLSSNLNGATLSNNIKVATPVNDNPTSGNNFSQLTYTYAIPSKMFSIAIGQYPIGNFDGNDYANNAQINFLNYALSQNPSESYANAGLGAFTQINFTKTIAAVLGAQSANNIRGANIQSNTFFKGPTTSFGHVSWTPQFPQMGKGTYNFIYYYQPSVPPRPGSTKGWSLSVSQNLDTRWGLFMRANGISPNSTTIPVTKSYAGGFIVNNPFYRHRLDQIGAGFAFNIISPIAFPVMPIRKNESVFELYYSYALDRLVQITPDIQFYVNPALNPNQGSALALSLRATLQL